MIESMENYQAAKSCMQNAQCIAYANTPIIFSRGRSRPSVILVTAFFEPQLIVLQNKSYDTLDLYLPLDICTYRDLHSWIFAP